jgi:hypothetical protein
VSTNQLIQRRPYCNYCLFEQVLPLEFRKPEVLDQPLPPDHPRRLIIEELCNSDDGVDCDMKAATMHFFHGERQAVQLDCVEIHKYVESKREGYDIGWDEAWRRWASFNDSVCFAQRFAEVYDWGRDRLTTKGMYEIIVADARTYRLAKALAERVKRKTSPAQEISSKRH